MKPFTTITIVVLFLIGFSHLLRLLLGWEINVDNTAVPMWVSMAGLGLSLSLAALLWWENRK